MAISNLPGCQSAPFSGECLTENLFNAMSHLNRKMNCDPKLEVDYHKVVSDEIINCGKDKSDFSEIMDWFSGSTVEVGATELWQRVVCNKDFNVVAGADAEAVAGAQVVLTLAPVSHANNGKDSYVQQGFELYHYRTQQTYTVVISPNKTTDYVHKATLLSFENRPANIKSGDRFFVSSSRTIGKNACSISPSTLLQETGFLTKSNPFRIEESWCLETGVDDFGQKEVYTFPLLDDNGNVHTYWEPYVKSQKRLALERAKAVKFFLGSRITNPNHPQYNTDFAGFDGYVNKIKYGGGRYHPISLNGVTLAHIDMVEQAARGYGISEFTWILPHQQRVNLERNLQTLFANSAGSCTFQSFERNGMDKEAVKKLGISSFSQNGFTHHIKTLKIADYEELIGNDFLKNSIFVMPTWGAKDVTGKTVPTFEFIKPIGWAGADKTYIEEQDDLRKRTPFCEKIEGVFRKVIWMRINCINNHWMFEAKSDC